ncbi:DUF488 domain-containing protein [Parafilimonas sp.]|uniref:DUF488 domain-containing protein n=1 Tax=Parafilimonas sp. TaxID=1969739 RepID=UPI003F7F209A
MHTKEIWTIGHSTRTLEHFAEMLHSFHIKLLADIRSFPGSRRVPQFNKENLEESMPANGIAYVHLKRLGGRRPVHKDSKNTGWRHPAFRGYADYMETDDFKKGIEQLEAMAIKQRTACMCSEAVWWSCHRSMVSDYLKLNGWLVHHIMEVNKATEHTYTQPAKIVNGKLFYGEQTLL